MSMFGAAEKGREMEMVRCPVCVACVLYLLYVCACMYVYMVVVVRGLFLFQ